MPLTCSSERHAADELLAALANRGIELARQNPRQIVRHAADVLGNGHVVVIQYDEHVDVEAARVAQRLVGKPRR